MLRETRASADRLPSRKPQEREEWFNKNFNAREAKILKRYKTDSVSLYKALKIGVLQAWPTESPEDRKAAQAVFDPRILREEMHDWAQQHSPGTPPLPAGSDSIDVVHHMQDASIRMGILAQKAPITRCPAKIGENETCGRKTVGKPGTKCYEHRAAVDPSE
jgi:hypothetical protein